MVQPSFILPGAEVTPDTGGWDCLVARLQSDTRCQLCHRMMCHQMSLASAPRSEVLLTLSALLCCVLCARPVRVLRTSPGISWAQGPHTGPQPGARKQNTRDIGADLVLSSVWFLCLKYVRLWFSWTGIDNTLLKFWAHTEPIIWRQFCFCLTSDLDRCGQHQGWQQHGVTRGGGRGTLCLALTVPAPMSSAGESWREREMTLATPGTPGADNTSCVIITGLTSDSQQVGCCCQHPPT